ncbi:MAG TPA: FHA domain-containing serine/threonine-protein kinase [Polyangiaceae bacterium]|jgi:serine/threonine-protein kinase|nr:FHA domain-containing serine/threonine-protein kinase [Polyangiaceae bacterium]
MAQSSKNQTPISSGTLVNERYEIRESLGKGGMGEVFKAYDRSTQQQLALKVVREESRMPGDDEALRQELLLARSVSHPNVCRVHDLAPSGWGPILVMEHIEGQTLHSHIRRKKAQGGYTADEFRRIASQICAGLAAIHAQGLVHGDFKPGNVMVTTERVVILDFGFAQERARLSARRPGSPPDGGTPNYMAPERLRSGGASQEDDLYALGLTLWEMWTCRVPEPGYKPRAKAMRAQIMFDVPSGLSIDEVKQVFHCLSDDPKFRIPARRLRFFNPMSLTTSQASSPRPKISPGPPLGRSVTQSFTPGAQSLLITYSSNAAELVGEMFPLNKPALTIGRRSGQDISIEEATVSGEHAALRWQHGSWVIDDKGSTNGIYADHSYDRKQSVTLLHGGEAQLGECRLKLVSFDNGSPQHNRAQEYLRQRDGSTGLFLKTELLSALEEELKFVNWAGVPLTLASYEIRGPHRLTDARPTILEMLALRRVAQRVVDITEVLLLSIVPVTAGRTGALKFCVAMVGPSVDEARQVVEQVVSQVQGSMPESLELVAEVTPAGAENTAQQLVS